jgi:hypothetical protein
MTSLRALALGLCLLAGTGSARGERLVLPPPVVHPHSTEICLNSRISYHGGWSSAGTDQMLGDVLHAAALAPISGGPLTIYAATAQNVYLYDPASHSLTVHKAGDWRSDNTAAFEVGVAADRTVDAGASMHLAQLESVALWTGTASQLASCPRASATTYANSNWNLSEPIDIAVSFGIRSVPGLTSTLVAVSSDGSLPNPSTDGPVYLDDALAGLAYGPAFAAGDLSLTEVSQVLWGAYGCSNHTATGKAGLVCASAVANYYLTRHVYSVGAAEVDRYHVRRPPGTDATTRDHRIELVRSGDTRPALRLAVDGLPDAPHYLVVCVGTTGAWQELEVGFAAMGAVLEASTIGLQGFVTAGLSSAQQSAIRSATGIPTSDIPIALVSLGHAGASGLVPENRPGADPGLAIENRLAFGGHVEIRYALPADAAIDLAIYDCQGQEVKTLERGFERRGAHAAGWDCRDGHGRAVLSGVYFCRLKTADRAQVAQVVIVR